MIISQHKLSLLKQAGLTDGEIRVYIALLTHGISTTGPIVDKSGAARSIVYQILERLMNKGLVSCIIKEQTKYYQAAHPEKIMVYLRQREAELSKTCKDLEDFLPQLNSLSESSPKSEVSMYIGYAGIKTAHEHLYQKLKRGETYYYLGVPSFQPQEMDKYWRKDHSRRIKDGIKMKALFNKDVDKKTLKNRNSYWGSQVRVMSVSIKTPATFAIFADTVLIVLQHPNPIAVEIVNQDIAKSFKEYFEEFWKHSITSLKQIKTK